MNFLLQAFDKNHKMPFITLLTNLSLLAFPAEIMPK
jgi:hypothetical protein